MTTHDTDIVAALRSELAQQLGPERFELWFGESTKLELTEQELSIGAPNRFFRDWLQTNFRSQLDSAVTRVGCGPVGLRFYVDATLPTPATQKTPATPAVQAASSAAESAQSSAAVSSTRSEGAPSLGLFQPSVASADQGQNIGGRNLFTGSSVGSSSVGGAAQGSRVKKPSGLKTFITGLSNRIARASAETVVARPGHFTPLVVYGSTGVGKTHLLQAIQAEWRRAHPTTRSIYLTAEQFTSSYIEALRGNGLPSFRQKYRGVRLLVLDDLQFFLGKRHTVIELLHTIDTLLREGQQIVVAADRPLDALDGLGTDLVSRLKSGLACEIDPPEHGTRLGILKQMVTRHQLEVPDDVLHYVASHLTAHARELSGAIYRLQATSEALAEPITLPMAEEALADLVRHSIRMVRLPDIQKAVCELFRIEPTSLHSKRTAKVIAQPRMLAMWLARKYTRAGLSEIGTFFGRRSHSTVLSAQKRVETWLAEGEQVVLAERVVRVDDAIRQVEKTLMAG